MVRADSLEAGTGGVLEVRELSVRLSGEARPILHDLSLTLPPGTALGIGGRSGCGKSTLLHTVAGLIPWLRPAEIEGEVILDGESLIDLDPGQRAHLLSTCLDRPDAQLFLTTVRQEIVAACRLHRCEERVSELASVFGIKRLMDRRITELSSGQRQRVALACSFAACPRPVLLDEPSAHLDADGVAALCSAVEELKTRGGSCVVVEQAGWRLADAVATWVQLENGLLTPGPLPDAPAFPRPSAQEHRIVMSCRGLAVARSGRRLVSGADFELRAGEVVLLTGSNGAGKSTLAQVLAGLRRPQQGSVQTDRRVALMLPSAELQLFGGTVATEVSEAGAGREETARVLRRHRLEHLAARAPWTLSRGERQRLVHAALDLMRPEVMIVDEPAQGLDPEDLAAFVDLVHRRAEKGRAYLLISHRPELARAVHRHIEIREGSLIEVP